VVMMGKDNVKITQEGNDYGENRGRMGKRVHHVQTVVVAAVLLFCFSSNVCSLDHP